MLFPLIGLFHQETHSCGCIEAVQKPPEILKNTETFSKGITEEQTGEMWRIFSLILFIVYSAKNICQISIDCHGELEA